MGEQYGHGDTGATYKAKVFVRRTILFFQCNMHINVAVLAQLKIV